MSRGFLSASSVIALLSMNLPAMAGDSSLPMVYFIAPLGAIVALVMAYVFYSGFMRNSEGTDDMIRIAEAVREGAYAYLKSQAKVVYTVIAVLVIILGIMGFILKVQDELTPFGVLIAALLSGLCGFLGMKTATNASARTANAAKHSLNDGLKVAFRAGAVMGLCVTGFALLDISVWFIILSSVMDVSSPEGLVLLTTITLTFAMGASLQALFARVGGGIYTKAADVGADLVGKVEAGIPEDDARNPATIADNVGDNVGDVAGMGADLYESYYGSILASMALAAAAALQLGLTGGDALKLVIAPVVIAGLGILCSVFAIFTVRASEHATFSQLLKSLHFGVWVSSAFIIGGSALVLRYLVGDIAGISWEGLWGAIVSGLVAGLVIAWGTEYFTSYEHKPTRRISSQSQTGPATVIIAGIAEGMLSTWIPLLTVVFAILLAFTFAGGQETFLLGVFGVGVAAVGMLSTLAITLATDAYGPIADNAGGNAEMTHQEPKVRERTDMLDSLGNTTAATGKGFAIGSAALTALALLAAYVSMVQTSLSQQVDTSQIQATQQVAYMDNGLVAIRDADDPSNVTAALLKDNNIGNIDKMLKEDGQSLKSVTDAAGNKIPGRYFVMDRSNHPHFVSAVPIRSASLKDILSYFQVDLMNPRVLCGLFIGVMLVFVFCAMTMNAVGRAAFSMMGECRRQFALMKEQFLRDGMSESDVKDPTTWPYQVKIDGKQYPDYASCVAISTHGALKEMVVPSLMAVVVPIVVGLVLGVPGVMGLLAGTLVCGFAVAIFMANAGGAWDNAKKYVETGEFGGKGSESHKAAIVGDTVGDPFKDTSGPSLNILLKLVSIVSVVFAGLIVKFSPTVSSWFGLS